MKKAAFGNGEFSFDGKTLFVRRAESPNNDIGLDASEVQDLIDFLHSLQDEEPNRRETFRVSTWKGCGLEVELEIDGKPFAVEPYNLSLTGIGIRHGESEPLDLSPDEFVIVTLRYEGNENHYRASLKRTDDRGYGFRFDDVSSSGSVDPLPDLTKMVMDLQKKWLANTNH